MKYIITALLLAIQSCSAADDNDSNRLQVTAVVSDERGRAAFECWEISTPFRSYPTVGKAIPDLAQVSNVSYVVLPARSREGLHNPPHLMFFVLLSGLAHVTLPDGDGDLWIMEGINNLIVAADVDGSGHYTEYPSRKETVALQIPFKDGEVPVHQVVKAEVCDARSPATMNRVHDRVGQLILS